MLKQPVGIVKLTNVALIKYKIKGKRLEIACYKNKAIDYRNGIEKDLSQVLQIEQIFTDAMKGKTASKKILNKVFPEKTKQEILKIIVEKGKMQISKKEREMLSENNYNDVVNMISVKIVHPISKKRFSIESIKAALKEVNYNIVYNKVAKVQALQAIKILDKYFFIERTGVLLKLVLAKEELLANLKEKFKFEILDRKSEANCNILIGSNLNKEFCKFLISEYPD